MWSEDIFAEKYPFFSSLPTQIRKKFLISNIHSNWPTLLTKGTFLAYSVLLHTAVCHDQESIYLLVWKHDLAKHLLDVIEFHIILLLSNKTAMEIGFPFCWTVCCKMWQVWHGAESLSLSSLSLSLFSLLSLSLSSNFWEGTMCMVLSKISSAFPDSTLALSAHLLKRLANGESLSDWSKFKREDGQTYTSSVFVMIDMADLTTLVAVMGPGMGLPNHMA